MSKTCAPLHSPLPWQACEPGAYSDFAGNSRVILADDRRIAVVQGTREQDAANAALIVAAPELLEAAQPALQLLEASLGVTHAAWPACRVDHGRGAGPSGRIRPRLCENASSSALI